MVGWYHSGPKLRSSDLQINELFKQYNPSPVLVVIDVKPNDLGLPTDAYYAVDEVHDVSIYSYARMELPQLVLLIIFQAQLKPRKPKK
jgi:proteasome lid subunit RPN8/RPN11